MDNVNGKLGIEEYKAHGKLSANNRQRVAECVLFSELKGDIEKQILRERYLELAEKIQDFFPGEQRVSLQILLQLVRVIFIVSKRRLMFHYYFTFQETYYIPYFKDALGKKHGPSGKLPDLLYNTRKRARRAGIRVLSKQSHLESAAYGDSGGNFCFTFLYCSSNNISILFLSQRILFHGFITLAHICILCFQILLQKQTS